MFIVKRNPHNPLIEPQSDVAWMAGGTFNATLAQFGHNDYLLFRAETRSETVLGQRYALSTIAVTRRKSDKLFSAPEQFIYPEFLWEKYGCEDPRVTYFEGKYYTFYTALGVYPFRAEGIKVAVAISRDLNEIDEKHLITPFNAKAMMMFPERINGKIYTLLTADTDNPPSKIAFATFDKISDMYSERYWNKWYENIEQYRLSGINRNENDHIELGAPPIKTKQGWLLIYSHIQNYFDERKRIFGIEALLLDLKDPSRIIAKTNSPILVPEEHYENACNVELGGNTSSIIFPTGAILEKDVLRIFYGSSDYFVCEAKLSWSDLLRVMQTEEEGLVLRNPLNPILRPTTSWQSQCVFNPAAFDYKGQAHILYRAMDKDNTSVMGHAISTDGLSLAEVGSEPVYVPRADFEIKKVLPSGFSGCEDARTTIIGKRIYMTYTAYNGIEAPAIAATSIDLKDFLARKYDKWTMPVIISSPGVEDKNSCIFPEPINGKYIVVHRVNHRFCVSYLPKLEFTHNALEQSTIVMEPRRGMWDSKKIGLACPPFKHKAGWILIYHGIAETGEYALGAALLDLKDPAKVLARTNYPILRPRYGYEKDGVVNNVVFSCGGIERKGYIYLYYGGADKYLCSAKFKIADLIKILSPKI